MMPLYSVEITYLAVVVADNENHATEVAEEHIRDIVRDASEPDDCYAMREIKTAMDLPAGWDVDCYPYGDADGMYIRGFLELLPPETERCTSTKDMFSGKDQ